MDLYAKILRLFKWRVDASGAPDTRKCVIAVAPHTSNWDFVLGYMAYRSLGRRANFLMKSAWFFFPLGIMLRKMGGIPVYRGKKKDSGGKCLVDQVIDRIEKADEIHVALTPEGTRKGTAEWHTGFLRIAYGAGVPVQLAVIDYRTKRIIIADQFTPSGDLQKDMERVRDFYAEYPCTALYPEKFILPVIDS